MMRRGDTASLFLRGKARLRAGQRALVIGASGSIGVSAVQIAAALGARVFDYENDLPARGGIGPVIDRRYALGDIAEAFAYVETGRKRGNVVVTPQPGRSVFPILMLDSKSSPGGMPCPLSDRPDVLSTGECSCPRSGSSRCSTTSTPTFILYGAILMETAMLMVVLAATWRSDGRDALAAAAAR
jgi:hypothetical protein